MSCKYCIKKLCSIYLDCTNLGTFSTPFTNTSTTAQNYTIEYSFMESMFSQTATIQPGDKVEFQNLPLNESYCYEYTIYDHNNVQMADGDFNVFQACTKKEYTL